MPLDRVRPGGELIRIATTGRGERPLPAAAVPFRERLAQSTALQFNQRIDRALAEIEVLGQRLSESLSQHDLRAYRDAIARLFRDVVHQMAEVRADLEWDSHSWEQRSMVAIRKVDEKLEELSRLVLEQEKDRLAILEAIGEIKGMLVDVRM